MVPPSLDKFATSRLFIDHSHVLRIKGATTCYLLSSNFCKHNFISKINNGPVLLLSLYVGIETVSCHLLQQVARMELLYLIPEKLTKKVIMASAPL